MARFTDLRLEAKICCKWRTSFEEAQGSYLFHPLHFFHCLLRILTLLLFLFVEVTKIHENQAIADFFAFSNQQVEQSQSEIWLKATLCYAYILRLIKIDLPVLTIGFSELAFN